MIKLKPYSALFLTLGGFLFAGMGIYFIFLRPSLLPEDSRYIGSSLLAFTLLWFIALILYLNHK